MTQEGKLHFGELPGCSAVVKDRSPGHLLVGLVGLHVGWFGSVCLFVCLFWLVG